MASLTAELFVIVSLIRGQVGSTVALDTCAFLGEEEENSLYEYGDVVIGGLFPLHYSPVYSRLTYKAKPTSNTYN